MRERERIATYFAPLTQGEPGSFMLTDDAAVITPPAGQQLVITTDSVIGGIHVLPNASARQFAQKLMRRTLSDLAAMGAAPWRYTLNLHTPRSLPDSWFAEFAATLADEQMQFGMVLIGGDCTSGSGAIHTSMTCYGLLAGAPLRRQGACVGDELYVSGTIGDAAIALSLLQQQQETPLAARYDAPEPRLVLGQALRGVASAAIDVSDGLMADIAQLCKVNGTGADIARAAIPLSPEILPMLQQNPALWTTILNGGDDYELCFTAPAHARGQLAQLARALGLALTRIGTITRKHVQLLDEKGAPIPIEISGWEY